MLCVARGKDRGPLATLEQYAFYESVCPALRIYRDSTAPLYREFVGRRRRCCKPYAIGAGMCAPPLAPRVPIIVGLIHLDTETDSDVVEFHQLLDVGRIDTAHLNIVFF